MPGPAGGRVIDSHPRKQEILDGMLAGRKLSELAAIAGLSRQSISLYKSQVLKPALNAAAKLKALSKLDPESLQRIQETKELTKALVAGDPLLDRVERKFARADRDLDRAARRPDDAWDGREVAQLERAETDAIRLHAELTGRLMQGGSTTNVLVAIGAPPGAAVVRSGETIDIEVAPASVGPQPSPGP